MFALVPFLYINHQRLAIADLVAERQNDLVHAGFSQLRHEGPGDAQRPGWLASVTRDLPLPLRLPRYPAFSSGVELLGGWGAEAHVGEDFFRGTLACGLLRTEWNPDRHVVGAAWGLVSHASDVRADYTSWKLPLLASWHRRGSGEARRYRWRVLWGVLADGDERRIRLLFVPVWRDR